MSDLPTFVIPGSETTPTDDATSIPTPGTPDAQVTDPGTTEVVTPSETPTPEDSLANSIAAALGQSLPSDPSAPNAPVDDPASSAGAVDDPTSSPGDSTISTDEPNGPMDPDLSEVVPDPTANLITLADGVTVDKAETLALVQWIDGLTPQQRAAMEYAYANPTQFIQPAANPNQSVASGNGYPGTVSPGSVPGEITPNAVGQPGAPVNPASVLPPVPDLEQLGEAFPQLKDFLTAQQAVLAQQQQAIDQQRQAQFQQSQAQLDQQRQRIQVELEAGIESFKTEHTTLTPEDFHYIQQEAGRSGLMAHNMAQFGNDANKAMKATLETVMWQTPKYRNVIVQQQAQQLATQQAEINARRENAAALSGTNGAGKPAAQSETTPYPTMRDHVAAFISGGQVSGS